jgi:hypothetical protein
MEAKTPGDPPRQLSQTALILEILEFHLYPLTFGRKQEAKQTSLVAQVPALIAKGSGNQLDPISSMISLAN